MFAKYSKPTLLQRLIITIDIVLIVVVCLFIFWDYSTNWKFLIENKKTSLDEEAKILLKSIERLQGEDDYNLQAYVDNVCIVMQESTSPGHHVVVRIGNKVVQARVHNRASPEIFTAIQEAAIAENALAPLGEETLIVGIAEGNDTKVYVSEYLSNLRKATRIQLIRRIITIVVVGVILALFINVALGRFISRPLKAMVNIVREFGKNNMQARMPDFKTQELGALSNEFNHMASSIEKSEKERCNRLQKARMIQQNLLPGNLCLEGVDVHCTFYPAAEVAGDYYDIFTMEDRSLLFCVADVIGHDVPAAMSAAMLKALLKGEIGREYDLSKLVYKLHTTFSEVTLESDFATLILVRWNPSNRRLFYVSAGHERGYLIKSNGEIVKLDSTGPILGIDGLGEWSQKELDVEEGARLVLITDGITESSSPEGEMYEKSRVVEIISEYRDKSVKELSEALIKSVTDFRNSETQHDDITMMAVDLL